MGVRTLPCDCERLQELLDVTSALTLKAEAVRTALREIELRPESAIPTQLQILPAGGFAIVQSVSRGSMLNEAILALALQALPILELLDLNEVDAARVRSLARSGQEAQGVEDSAGAPQSEDLFLDVLLQVVSEDQPLRVGELASEEAHVDRLRLGLLVHLVQELRDQSASLCQRLRRAINPPSIRDRVQVDRTARTIKIDDETFHVTNDDALVFFDLLANANGGVVSGSEVATALHLNAFRVTRIKAQLPKSLSKLIKSGDHKTLKRRGSWLVLPSLP